MSMWKTASVFDNGDRRNNLLQSSRLRAPKGSPNGGAKRRRSLQEDAMGWFARYYHWFILSVLLTFITLHWLLELEKSLANNESLPEVFMSPPPRVEPLTHGSVSAFGRKYNPNVLLDQDTIGKKSQKKELSASSNQVSPALPAAEPFIPNYTPTASRPLRTIFLGRADENHPFFTTASTSQYYIYDQLLDGLDRSPFFKVVQAHLYNPLDWTVTSKDFHSLPIDEPTLIVVDWAPLQRDCHVLDQMLEGLKQLAERENIYLLYIDVSPSTKTVTCPVPFIPKERTRVAKRGIIEGRHWNSAGKWVEPGAIAVPENVLHFPHYLRQEFVDVMNTMETRRKNDIAHFWRKGDYSHYSLLRRRVGQILKDYDGKHTDKHLRIIIRTIGDETSLPYDEIEPDYVEALLSTRIVVIAQRDEWEDHYRLMESLAGGALVLSDAMLAPPPGLQNGTHLVFYDSSSSLRSLLDYYTTHAEERDAIAANGQAYALGTQRSWHALERVVFGAVLTQVESIEDEAPKRKHPFHTHIHHHDDDNEDL
ncbi:hypothetical protein FisN_1Hh595 [Fistulifera solaris]|uniref:Spore protein YkvP/CgeB glycosyl transferase-like domain-containing protein n=1 Tax=Fistulifera solaris TaxID=1519565 RepID=A0A1Z5KQL4_FISSO|nr:hypothetical protein FisN_1Hh595 [Fistulifera solaris]|eukprot:GAX28614.1 hypothetical protein FisN_1Hh595 [Fistulifera solaris]